MEKGKAPAAKSPLSATVTSFEEVDTTSPPLPDDFSPSSSAFKGPVMRRKPTKDNKERLKYSASSRRSGRSRMTQEEQDMEDRLRYEEDMKDRVRNTQVNMSTSIPIPTIQSVPESSKRGKNKVKNDDGETREDEEKKEDGEQAKET